VSKAEEIRVLGGLLSTAELVVTILVTQKIEAK